MVVTIERQYSSGRKFYIVECVDCQCVLNSGHHYSDQALAQKTAEAHIVEDHISQD